MPLRAIFFAGMILLGAAAALAAWLYSPTPTEADIVPGEYSMEVDVAPARVALGDTFVATVGVFHNEPTGYSAVQWHVNYDETRLSVVSIARSAGAPSECLSQHVGFGRVLVGCLAFLPNSLTFSGNAFDIVFECIDEGSAALVVEIADSIVSPSDVYAEPDGAEQPIHAHSDGVDCSATAPTNTPGPTATPSPTPITGPRGGIWRLLLSGTSEVEVGVPFRLNVGIIPADTLGYRSADWWIFLPPDAAVASFAPAPGATDCLPYGAHPYLLGICAKYGINELMLSGTAFHLDLICAELGPMQIAIGPPDGDGFDSSVYTGGDPAFLEAIEVNTHTVECLEPLPFIGLVKAIDGELPAEGEGTMLRNLWLCYDQATDGVDNDGDSTVDNESATCGANGEGHLDVEELVFAPRDCDTRNDDDDGDGRPVDGSVADGSSTAYVGSNPRPECAQPTLEDFVQDEVDKDGGEVPEGLGAIEFQVKFDHKIFDIMVTESDDESDGIDNDGDTLVDEPDEDWANGRFENCSMTIISENDIRFGCVTSGGVLGHFRPNGISVADIRILPEADLSWRLRPGKDNGVARRILQENCEVADIFGDIFPHTNAGLTPACTDLDITVRRLEGDLDTDCDVTIIDAQRVAFRYGAFFGQLLYDPHFDLEPFVAPDFDVDIKDLQFVFGRVGSTCAAPIPDNQDPIAAQGVGQP